jgi:hypothetical protein
MTVDEVRPLSLLSEEGYIIPMTARALRIRQIDPNMDKPFKKLKYIIMKYVFENITNEEMVPSKFLNVEVFALALFDLHDELSKLKQLKIMICA